MTALVANNATATLAGTAGVQVLNTTQTSIVLTSTEGQLFPNPVAPNFFYATLVNAANAIEVVKCTARAGDTLTVVRGVDGTTALNWNGQDRLELRPTAGLFNNKLDLDTGGVLGSNLQVATLSINGPSNVARPYIMQTAGLNVWSMVADNAALGTPGSNVGSNFAIGRFADTTGNFIDNPFYIYRSTGQVLIGGGGLQVNGLATFNGGISLSGAVSFTTVTVTNTLTVNGAATFATNLTVDGLAYFAGSTTNFFAGNSAGHPTYGLASGVYMQYNGSALTFFNGAGEAWLDTGGTWHAGGANVNTLTVNTSMSGAAGAIPFTMLGNPATNNIGTSGCVQLPGGLIIQWGTFDSGSDTGWGGTPQLVNYPIHFPTACLNVQAISWNNNTETDPNYAVQVWGALGTVGTTFACAGFQSGTPKQIRGFFWFALGH